MRILFAGTPQFAVPALAATAERFEVCAVLTAPERPSGRGRKLIPSPVQREADRIGLPVIATTCLDDVAMREVTALRADLLVVAAFGVIFTQRFLELFRSGAVNIHPSLLPRFRGAAPIPAAILAGERETGVSIQRVVRRIDSGPIMAQCTYQLDGTETTGRVTSDLAESGADLLIEVLDSLNLGTAKEVVQTERYATYCSKVTSSDSWINWEEHNADAIERMVRAYDPWPHASCRAGNKRLNLLAARVVSERSGCVPGQIARVDSNHGILIDTTRGTLGVSALQIEGRRAMGWKDFVNGHNELMGMILT